MVNEKKIGHCLTIRNESNETWIEFLKFLKDTYEFLDDSYLFMCDEEKGIANAVHTIFKAKTLADFKHRWEQSLN